MKRYQLRHEVRPTTKVDPEWKMVVIMMVCIAVFFVFILPRLLEREQARKAATAVTVEH